ncbi:MAG: DUF1080 domain-containing protein [Acidobacteria bacterium]|nr:DUF1080 domain-containing protein [Acidobacteriota bacterium]
MTLPRRALLPAIATWAQPTPNWISMFDGNTLGDWKEAPFEGRGKITTIKNTIQLGKGRITGIAWTGAFPKSNYEIRFEAVRITGKDFFAGITFPVNDTHCTWINGGWDGTVVGLSNLDGNDASENDTSTSRDFETGRWYAFRLAVAPNRIQAWIDNAEIINVDITKRRVSIRFDDLDLCLPLGFASYATEAGLRNIAWRRLAI